MSSARGTACGGPSPRSRPWGYGDSYPTTTAGRIIAIVVMLVGIGFVAILTAAAAERFMREQRADEAAIEKRPAEIARRLDAIERQG